MAPESSATSETGWRLIINTGDDLGTQIHGKFACLNVLVDFLVHPNWGYSNECNCMWLFAYLLWTLVGCKQLEMSLGQQVVLDSSLGWGEAILKGSNLIHKIPVELLIKFITNGLHGGVHEGSNKLWDSSHITGCCHGVVVGISSLSIVRYASNWTSTWPHFMQEQ